jgi:hypothetical protein
MVGIFLCYLILFNLIQSIFSMKAGNFCFSKHEQNPLYMILGFFFNENLPTFHLDIFWQF